VVVFIGIGVIPPTGADLQALIPDKLWILNRLGATGGEFFVFHGSTSQWNLILL
jgi:hypothetical protein